jgi:hypothetical protein
MEESGDQDDETPYSKALRAKLVELKEGETPQDVGLLVRLGKNIYGEGSVPRGTKVLSNEQLVKGVGPFNTGYGRYLIFALIAATMAVVLLLWWV